jgi:hypothetical protein
MEEAEAEELTYTPATCVHPYYLSWAGKCEGCRKVPLSPNSPDPYNREPKEGEDNGNEAQAA